MGNRNRNRLTMAALVALLLTMGAAPLVAVPNDSKPVVYDTEPAAVIHGISDEPDPSSHVEPVDCRNVDYSKIHDVLGCEFHKRSELLGYSGVVMAVAERVPVSLTETGWLLGAVTPAPFTPADACTQGKECADAVKTACKAAGKTTNGATWSIIWFIDSKGKLKGTCSGTCGDGSAVYVTCVSAAA